MGSKSIGMTLLILAGALGAGFVAAQQTPPQARGSKATGNESWQIEQRRRWWIESRGLDKVRGAGDMRRSAVRTLRIQMAREASAGRAPDAVWRELGPSSMRMGNWTMGRVSGRINAIAPHPTNDSILYVGSANGGVWKSTDAGVSWTPTFADVGSQSIGALFVEPGIRRTSGPAPATATTATAPATSAKACSSAATAAIRGLRATPAWRCRWSPR